MELANGGVDAVLGIDEDFAGPEAPGNFGAGDELAFAGDEQDEQLHGLAFDAQKFAVAQQLKAAAVKLEVAELVNRTGHGLLADYSKIDLIHVNRNVVEIRIAPLNKKMTKVQ